MKMNLENDKFPAGLRVLVVDDDITCLRLMESLLKKCHYHVTITNQAREALRMLKENKNRFDIVITDVEMPEIDGIKLLQLVGLEMNLPVIMLSAYSDTKLVMQGIRNGACDYLVKPVRIQELQNIWQHVVRKNKSTPQRAVDYPTGGSNHFAAPNGSATQDMSHRGKGIAESSGDDNGDDEMEEGGRENEDPTTHKKPRLFWSVELHQKFVDAVNQLGLDKAFPKKILDLMNVEGLTREKVASHLQKYRLYLRKVNSGANQQGNGLDVLGQEDAHIGPLGGGYGVYRSLGGPGGMFGRLNTAAGLSLRGLSSSPMLQTNPNNSLNTFGKFEYVNQPPSNVGGLVTSGVANFPNWGTNHLDFHGIASTNASIQNDPLDIFCGGNSHNQDSLSGFNNLNNNNSMAQLEGSSSKNDHNFHGHYLLDDPKLISGSGQSNSEYLEEMVGRFLK